MIVYEELSEVFSDWVTTNKSIEQLWKLNNAGNATYINANAYAEKVASKWGELLTDAYAEENISAASNEISLAYKKAFSESAYYSKNVQKGINAKMNLRIKAIEPQIDEERIANLLDVLNDTDTTEIMAQHLLDKSAIEPLTRYAVTQTIKANAGFQSDAGIYAYVERDAGAGCCKWCNDLAGRYEFGDQPKDFFAVHDGCTCTIDYKPSRTRDAVRLRYDASQRRFN